MLFTGMIDQDKKQKNKNYWKKNGVCVCVCVWKTLRLNNDEVLGKNTHIYNKTLYNKQAHSHTHTHTDLWDDIYNTWCLETHPLFSAGSLFHALFSPRWSVRRTDGLSSTFISVQVCLTWTMRKTNTHSRWAKKIQRTIHNRRYTFIVVR